MAFVRLSSNKSSAKAFPKVSITLLYYRYSIICQASITDSIKNQCYWHRVKTIGPWCMALPAVL